MAGLIMRRMAAIGSMALLGGCAFFSPSTTVDVIYPLPDGRELSAHYSSTKDFEAPEFEFVRGADGQVQTIRMSAAGSTASTVQAENRAIIGSVVEGAVRGALEGVKRAAPVPGVSFTPAEIQMIRAMRNAGMLHEL